MNEWMILIFLLLEKEAKEPCEYGTSSKKGFQMDPFLNMDIFLFTYSKNPDGIREPEK